MADSFVEAIGLGVWAWDMETGEVAFDERWARIAGYSLAELSPFGIDTWQRLYHPDDLAASQIQLDRHARGEIPYYDVEVRLRHHDGHWLWVRDRGRIVDWGEGGRPARMVGTHEDISVRRDEAQAVERHRAQLRQAQRIANLGSWHLDITTGHMEWTEELFRMLGMDPAGPPPDVPGHERLFTEESWLRLSSALAATLAEGTAYELELEMRRADGSHGWMLARGEAQRDASGTIVGILGVALDITERRRSDDELRRLATRDQLTGLANRAAILEEIDRALRAGLRTGRVTAVLLVDLDGFKRVNDSLGHAGGDRFLVEAAERLVGVVRGEDLVGRLGGDEYVVVMREIEDLEAASISAHRIIAAFRTPMRVGDADLGITASAGIAYSTPESASEDLVRDADTAMYAAKAAGRDRVIPFNEELRERVTSRLAIEAALRQALDKGELEVWYQPEVRFDTGAVVALEALLRWRHPEGDVDVADRFVDVAEDTGMIVRIGAWVLLDACTHMADWLRDEPLSSVVVRVNVSAVQMADDDFLGVVDDALAASGLPPDRLCLEITETVLLHDTATVRANVLGVHARGIVIALDDFGTGYASMSYLHRYPVDLVKIDRSFIVHITTNEGDCDLVAGIVAFAERLGYRVMAEGVETTEQAALLVGMNCPSAQGYLFSRAVPAALVPGVLGTTYAIG